MVFGICNILMKKVSCYKGFPPWFKKSAATLPELKLYNIVAYFKQIVTTKGVVQAVLICGRFLCSVRSRCCRISRKDQFVMAEFVFRIEETTFCCCFWCKMCLQFHFLQKFWIYFCKNVALM